MLFYTTGMHISSFDSHSICLASFSLVFRLSFGSSGCCRCRCRGVRTCMLSEAGAEETRSGGTGEVERAITYDLDTQSAVDSISGRVFRMWRSSVWHRHEAYYLSMFGSCSREATTPLFSPPRFTVVTAASHSPPFIPPPVCWFRPHHIAL